MSRQAKIITVAGMHRSGTSLTANWLEARGLNIGDRLMSGEFDNPRGHFEDLDILAIHEEDLKRKGLRSNGLRLHKRIDFTFDEIARNEINNILSKREGLLQWGWKEPRTTIYLNEWKRLIPQLKVLAVYRPAHEVVDSLVRRTKLSLKANKFNTLNRLAHKLVFPFYIKWEAKNFLNAWIYYNKAIIDFQHRYPDDIIICSLSGLIDHSESVIDHMIKKFELDLNRASVKDLFENNLLNKSDIPQKETSIKKKKEVLKIDELIKEVKIA